MGRDLVETAVRLVELAALKAGDRRLELVSGGLLRLFALIPPVAEAARREDDQRRAGHDQVLVFLPEFRRLVAPDLLVDFLKDIGHYRGDLSQRHGESERQGRLRARWRVRVANE